MDGLTQYHRCLTDVTNLAQYKQNLWVGDDLNERQPLAGSFGGYQYLTSVLRPMDLKTKPNQNFRGYATQWEQNNTSVAGATGALRFVPVVSVRETAAGFPVVGHYGTVGGGYIVVPKEHVNPGERPGWLVNLLQEDIPAYVVGSNYPAAGAWRPMSSSFYRYEVLTDIEGRVMTILSASRPDDSIESINPLQFVLADEVFGIIGKGVGKLLGSLVRKAAQLKVVRSLAAEMVRWGKLETGATVGTLSVAKLRDIRATMQRVMGNLIEGESKMLRPRNLRELDQALRQDGFHLVEAEAWGPPGGYQLFYRNGNVVSRVKTMGDKLGPRVNKPHASFSLHDGESLQWTSDIAKFNNQGGISAKNIVSLEDWTAKNMGKPGAGNQWYVVKEGHTRAVGDVWANSTHFNAQASFNLDGLKEILGRLKGQIYHEFPKRP